MSRRVSPIQRQIAATAITTPMPDTTQEMTMPLMASVSPRAVTTGR